MGGKAHTSI